MHLSALLKKDPLHSNLSVFHQIKRSFPTRQSARTLHVRAAQRGDFDAFLARLNDCAAGIGIPDGFVAHSTFWLVRYDAEVVGVSNIRHTLTPALRQVGGHIGYGIRPSARARHLRQAERRIGEDHRAQRRRP